MSFVFLWIPASAGMTVGCAGMMGGCAGMTCARCRLPAPRAYPARIASLARAPFALRKGLDAQMRAKVV